MLQKYEMFFMLQSCRVESSDERGEGVERGLCYLWLSLANEMEVQGVLYF